LDAWTIVQDEALVRAVVRCRVAVSRMGALPGTITGGTPARARDQFATGSFRTGFSGQGVLGLGPRMSMNFRAHPKIKDDLHRQRRVLFTGRHRQRSDFSHVFRPLGSVAIPPVRWLAATGFPVTR
jgi:hypothetical protein